MDEASTETDQFEGMSGRVVSVEDLFSPRWREKLDYCAHEADPWEISISEMAEEYQRELDELDEKDLELSGRMVLTCAVLLRVKAEELQGQNSSEEEEMEEEMEQGFWGYEMFDDANYVPGLDLPLKRINKRTVTRDELRGAFDSAVEVYERREERWSDVEGVEDRDWGMDLEEDENFRVKLQRLYRKVKQKFSRGKEVLFSSLLDRNTKEEKFTTFMELIHLQSEGKVRCKQKEHFGEIKVELSNRGTEEGQERSDPGDDETGN